MNYELYHDESQVHGFWHGMLLVPQPKKALLLEYLQKVRSNSGYQSPLKIKKVRKQNKVFGCAFAWLTVAVAAMRSRGKGVPPAVYLCENDAGRKQYCLFHDLIAAKFILFCERDNLSRMSGHRDHGSKVETTFRMGLKGGMHFLGQDDDPIRIERMHFDGHEHLRRHVDDERVIGRLEGLRGYCEVTESYVSGLD